MAFNFTRVKTAFAAAMLSCLVGAVLASSASAKTDNLRIGWTPSPNNIALQVAQDKGFFKAQDLNVTLTQQPSASAVLYPALGKQYDLVTSQIADVMQLYGKGQKNVMISGMNRYPAARNTPGATPNLMVKKGTVKGYGDFKGKTICSVSATSGGQVASFLYALSVHGVSKKDIKIVAVPFANMLDQLKSGRCDAALAINPYIAQMKAAGYAGFANTLFSLSGKKAYLATVYMATAKDAKKNPGKYQKYNKAIAATRAWMNDPKNYAEWRRIAATTLKLNAAAVANQTVIETQTAIIKSEVQLWVKPLTKIGFIKKKTQPKNVNTLIFKYAPTKLFK
jgi:ABC-type nitrate/sulfonate/bicarbonate transport system substrate-binding protein